MLSQANKTGNVVIVFFYHVVSIEVSLTEESVSEIHLNVADKWCAETVTN